MRTRVLTLCLFMVSGFAFLNTSAQQPVFKNYTTAQGLPSSETYYSLQDHKGYLWFATDRGLAKYDGYGFQIFSTNEGMPENSIFKLVEDQKGRIWFMGYSLKIAYIENDEVHLYKYNALLKSIFPYEICNIFVDAYNSLWVNYLSRDTFKILRISAEGRVDSSYNHHPAATFTVYVSQDGNCEASGINNAQVVQFISIESAKKLFSFPGTHKSEKRTSFTPRNKETTWIYSGNKVILFKNGIWKKILETKDEPLSCFVDSFENIWIGYKNDGVAFYPQKDNYRTYKKFLKQCSVTSIIQDAEGGMWFTSLEKGVYYFPPTNPFSYTEEDGLESSRINRIELIDSNLVLIIPDYKVGIIQKEDLKLKVLNYHTTGADFDIKYKAPDRIYVSGAADLKLPFHKKQINLGAAQKILIGKNYIWGVYYLSIEKFDFSGKLLDSISFLKIARVKCVFEERNGNLLVGTIDGLYEYDGKNIRSLKELNPVWANRVSDIKRIDNTHIAITTLGIGILVIQENDFKRPLQYAIKAGLPGLMCNVIFVEDSTVFWVGTNNGLCRISNILNPKKAKFVTMDVSEGIKTNEVNDILLFQNNIWIATTDGVSILSAKPASLKYVSPIYLEKVKINGISINKGQPPTLAYNDNQVSFFYTGINYMDAGKLQYKYRLLPNDSSWSYTYNRSVIYNALGPGKYTFELTAINPFRLNSAPVVSYSFQILSPFWKTWWFIFLVFISCLSLIYVFIYYRIRFIKAQVQIKNDLDSFREKALRAQMNPHFIYNSINSIQSYMVKNELAPSISYLSKFSKLMRLVFSNTDIALVSLQDDLDAVKLYVEMEHLRFPDKFNYSVIIDPAINPTSVQIPPLIIQPFIENAILHGMLTKTGKGNIRVYIDKNGDGLSIKIEDDGIGRKLAGFIKKRKEQYNLEDRGAGDDKRKSSGITVTSMRIQQAWAKKPGQALIKITDLFDEDENTKGTLVEFNLPLTYD